MITAACFGIALQVESEDPAFEAFVARNYRSFLGALSARPDIEVRFGPRAGQAARDRKAGMASLGMGLHFDNASLYWENDFGFSLLVTPGSEGGLDGGFAVEAYHFDLERETDPDLRARNHQRSMRWAIHFPLFVLLGERAGLRLAHASALARNDARALVFCGLNKVGKSTLAAFLAQQAGYRFMTDNFLLADEGSVYGFPEALRLDPDSLARLGLAPAPETTVYGKHHIEVGPEDTCLQADPAAVFLVTNGPSLFAEPLDAGKALRTLAGLHGYLGEFPEQSFLAGLPLLGGAGPVQPGCETTVLSRRPWYQLSLPKDWELGDVKELVESCI